MTPPLYSPLPDETFSIRLIKLQPSNDTSAPIFCQLVTYPINQSRPGAHAYECLSYVWGTETYRKPIEIDNGESNIRFEATPNLYEALVHLRDPFFEQIFWIDAICIDQGNEEEKATQVAAMAKIYGLAKRVIVWLGVEADDSALAFQRLRDLAQARQLNDQSASGLTWLQHGLDTQRIPDSNDDKNMDILKAEQAIHTLLDRRYFRRMWILQEVTAARNMLFKCGKEELQTATFITGLSALKRLADSNLRGCLLAFLLLVNSSAFRESLKGQAHLNIEPLTELIDRFHGNDATDARDKIYALWGLCSDSDSMEHLRPDYTKEWKDLLRDLGRLTFGKNSVISASADYQMMFVRTTGCVLGRVEKFADLMEERLWESTQVLGITSLTASISLSHTNVWSTWIKLRSSAEQIQKGDLVMFLPRTSRIVFARPQEYYFRIVMVIDSRKVAFNRESGHSSWRSWQTYLDNIDETAGHLPLLWSWERHYEQEEKRCLELMARYDIEISDESKSVHSQALYRARALSDMAAVYTNYKEYGPASNSLTKMVEIYKSVRGKKSSSHSTDLQRLEDALGRHERYCKAKSILQEPQDRVPSKAFIVDCAAMVFGEAMINDQLDQPDYVLVDLISKEMSKGVSRQQLFQALMQCPDFESGRSSIHLNVEQLPEGYAERHDSYFQFLLELAEDDITASESDLLVAARKRISDLNFIRLAKRIRHSLQYLPEILDTLRFNSWNGMIVKDLIKVLGDRVNVTPEAINAATGWDLYALSALLKTPYSVPVVAPAAFTLAMQNISTSTRAIIELLIQHAQVGCEIGEEILTLIAWNNKLDRTELQWIYVSLLEHTALPVDVHDEVLFRASSGAEVTINNVNELLRFRPAFHFSRGMLLHMTQSPSSVLKDVLASTGPIRQNDIDSISANGLAGFASFINLVRYRKNEFTITRDIVLKVINEEKKHATESSWLYGEDETPWKSLLVIDRCTAFLIKHAEDDVIDPLLSSSILIEIAACRGFPLTLEALQGRSKKEILHFDCLHSAAEICQLLQQPLKPGEPSSHAFKTENLIRQLSEMAHTSLSNDVVRAMYLHASGGPYQHQISKMLLDSSILETSTISSEDHYADTASCHQERLEVPEKLARSAF